MLTHGSNEIALCSFFSTIAKRYQLHTTNIAVIAYPYEAVTKVCCAVDSAMMRPRLIGPVAKPHPSTKGITLADVAQVQADSRLFLLVN